MKTIVSIGFLFVFSFVNAQTPSKAKSESTKEYVTVETDKIFEKLLKIRRNLHANPELAHKEVNTQKVIKQYLLDLGLEVKTDVYGYAVIGILKGSKAGKSIAWRADMDALPNDFPDNVEFKSTVKNVQHGCGHDVHMTIALGIAEVLSKNKKGIKGTVYFIFQPEEESFTGAKGMVENKIFSSIKPSEIYGLHITPFAMGQIIVEENEMYAYQKGVRIKFQSKLSEEQLSNLHQKIRNTITRTINNSKPWELQNALHPTDGLANPNTIFRDYSLLDEHFSNYSKNDTLFLEFDVYETDKNKLNRIIPEIRKVVEAQGLASKPISIEFFKENPTIQNDANLTKAAIHTLNMTFGNATVTNMYGQVPFSNDDFSYFQQKVPGVYFFLGGSNFEKGMIAMIHAPNFMVDEESIRIGVKSFSALLIERLRK
jgi:metal-dependent amidase/aminoacylase/carboxypeptidase family protein